MAITPYRYYIIIGNKINHEMTCSEDDSGRVRFGSCSLGSIVCRGGTTVFAGETLTRFGDVTGSSTVTTYNNKFYKYGEMQNDLL